MCHTSSICCTVSSYGYDVAIPIHLLCRIYSYISLSLILSCLIHRHHHHHHHHRLLCLVDIISIEVIPKNNRKFADSLLMLCCLLDNSSESGSLKQQHTRVFWLLPSATFIDFSLSTRVGILFVIKPWIIPKVWYIIRL